MTLARRIRRRCYRQGHSRSKQYVLALRRALEDSLAVTATPVSDDFEQRVKLLETK